MILYSTQNLSIFEKLQKGETHYACSPSFYDEPDVVDEMWVRSYDWISDRMEERIGPKPNHDVYPTWAYYHWYGAKKKKPDLRYTGARCFAEKRTCALMTLEIPDNEVLLSDYDTWHCVLNQWYLGEEKRSGEIWDITRENKHWREYKDYPNWLKQELYESWLNVFDMELSRKYFEIEEEHQTIQATFWQIKPEYVKEAVKFDRKGKTVKLL